MKTLLLILALTVAASAQIQSLPCLVDTAPPGLNSTELYKDGSGRTYKTHKPEWTLRPAFEQNFKIKNGGWYSFYLYMPVDGDCTIYFTSYDDSDDLNSNAANLLGNYIEKPKGDIEILVGNSMQFFDWTRGQSTSMIYSSGRRMSGVINVRLPMGFNSLIISNKHSKLAPKSVDIIVGDPKQKPKALAP